MTAKSNLPTREKQQKPGLYSCPENWPGQEKKSRTENKGKRVEMGEENEIRQACTISLFKVEKSSAPRSQSLPLCLSLPLFFSPLMLSLLP